MSTRHAEPGDPISFNKYMSSPDYRELRGIDGIAATEKARLLIDPRKRNLLFFIQAMSLRPGGSKGFLDDVIAAFPKHFSPRGGSKAFDLEAWVAAEMRGLLDRKLIELCIDPECPILFPESDTEPGERLDNLTAAVLDYQKQFEEKARECLAATKTADQVWSALDRALQHRKMVVLEGEPGIGKTKASEAWCEAHLGEARFVTLKGCVNKTSIFRTIGRALGIGCGYMRGATELQARIEDVLQRSRLLLVIDESHFLFGQSERIYSRPEMIDWIDTALCNERVPVALVATPQLTKRLCQVERQTMWQSAQFRRRIKDFTLLESKITAEDCKAVARKLLPRCSESGIKLAAGQARLSDWPLSWLADTAEDALAVAKSHGRECAQFDDVQQAIDQFRTPSDLAQKTALARAQKRPNRRSYAERLPELSAEIEEVPAPDRNGRSAIARNATGGRAVLMEV